MRSRGRNTALLSIALLGAVAWACSDDYTEAPSRPLANDAGPVEKRDADPILKPSNPPGITVAKISVARGESTKAKFVVTRGDHGLPLDIVGTDLPSGISVAPVKLPIDTTDGEIEVSAAVTAAEGAVTIELALLEGNAKLATSSAIVDVGPLRAGNLDPSFGKGGVVDLDLPRSLLALSEDGTLYVEATSGLTRWLKDGTHDLTYGPVSLNGSFQPWTMLATDSGQVYFGGYLLTNGAAPVIYRTTSDGKSPDKNWGTLGGTTVATVPSSNGLFNVFALGLTPTAMYALVHLEKDGSSGLPGPTTIARMSLAGEADTSYGTSGYIQLPNDAKAPEIAFFDSIGVDHFVLTSADVSGGQPFFRVYEGTPDKKLTPRLGGYGEPSALAYDGVTTESFLARANDAGTALVRVGDAGASATFDLGPDASVNDVTVDAEGRFLLTGCHGWTRYLPDGGVDSNYKNGSTPEMNCILAARLTEKYIYLAGVGGSPEKLRYARLVR